MEAIKELLYLAGDVPDPFGTGRLGRASTMDLTKKAIGHPQVFYRNLVLELDVYGLPNQPRFVHMICPICRNALRISEENKAISYDPQGVPPVPPGWSRPQLEQAFPNGLGGLISIESFECAWELEPSLRRDFGLAICPLKIVIDRNIARDAA